MRSYALLRAGSHVLVRDQTSASWTPARLGSHVGFLDPRSPGIGRQPPGPSHAWDRTFKFQSDLQGFATVTVNV